MLGWTSVFITLALAFKVYEVCKAGVDALKLCWLVELDLVVGDSTILLVCGFRDWKVSLRYGKVPRRGKLLNSDEPI